MTLSGETPSVPMLAHSSPHPRGIFEDLDCYPGMRLFRVFACCGLVQERSVPTHRFSDRHMDEMKRDLDDACPLGSAHGPVCPSEPGRPALTLSITRHGAPGARM